MSFVSVQTIMSQVSCNHSFIPLAQPKASSLLGPATYSIELSERQLSRKTRSFLEALCQKFPSIEIGALSQTLQNVIPLESEVLKNALNKKQGYLSRFFSTESWEEWVENRTSLGKVVSQFIRFAQSSMKASIAIDTVSSKTLITANEEAEAVLRELEAEPFLNSRPTPHGSLFMFSMAEAALVVPKIEKVREAVAALQNVFLTEDMIKRIVEDNKGINIEPKVIESVKYLVNVLGSISNFSDIYGNLIQGHLEEIATDSIMKFANKYEDNINLPLERILKIKAVSREIQELQFKGRNLLGQINHLEEEENAKTRTLEGIRAEMRQKFDQKDALNRKIKTLQDWMKNTQDYLTHGQSQTKIYNEWVQKNKDDLSDEQIFEASDVNQNFQQQIASLQPKVIHATAALKARSKELEAINDSISNLYDYLKRTEATRDEFTLARNKLVDEVNEIGEQLGKLIAYKEEL